MNFARFDLSESAYAVALMADLTPAWREVYGRILTELVHRHTTFWAAIDWLTQIGPDPRRSSYPPEWIDTYLPKQLVGHYDVPGWVANGIEPWGLQVDPIGADGNLFFKGWLNLLMALRGRVTGEDRRRERFEVAGVGGTRFEWTHARLADWLVELWRRHPEGPHCENTKVWPYCLNAAGLGLDLFDSLYGTDRHHAWQRWNAETRGDYFGVEGGRVRWVTLYYDPLIGHKQTIGPSGGLANAIYLLPQDPGFAELLYRGAVGRAGWSDPSQSVRPTADPRFVALGWILAAEFGDEVTDRRLGLYAEEHFEPRHFGDDDGQFGWWFRLGEPWPRGQLSALMMMAEVGGRGAWSRLFRQPDLSRFREPTVEGVDFPALGVSAARNDPAQGALAIEVYRGDQARAGATTTFRVSGLISPTDVRVRCDGQEHQRWRALDGGTIEVETEVASHHFEVVTAPWIRSGAPTPPQPSATTPPVAPSGRVIRPRSVGQATTLQTAVPLGCPCCG
jgi:hypothetical protein